MSSLNPNTKVKTKRLILLPVAEQFKYEICREFTPEVTQYMPYTPKGEIQMTEDFIHRSDKELEEGKGIQFCILQKESNEFMGCCGLHHTHTKKVEIGIWLKKSVHGLGYGTETVQALMDLAEKHIALDYIYYPVDKDNIPSRKIPEKLGFLPAKTYKAERGDRAFEYCRIQEEFR